LHSTGSEEAPGWEIRRVSLAFRAGEAPVFRIPLSVHVPTRHFLDVSPVRDAEALPPAVRRSRADGALLRSHPVEERVRRLELRGRWIRYCPAQYTRFLANLDRPHEEYLAGFSAKTRSTLQRKVRRFLAEAGPGEAFREYRTPAELDEFYPLARSVSARTFQETLLDSGLPTDEPFRLRMKDLAARDLVRAYLLFKGSQPVAYLYCPAMGESRILLYQYLGYDPDYASLSPGTVLQYLALLRLFAEGTWRLFDFLEGETQEKRQFSTLSIRCADVYYLRRTIRSTGIVLLHILTESASDLAARLLERAGLKQALKRWIRRSAGGGAGGARARVDANPTPPDGEGKG
jgi:CelD/BcsL family acetyltransferase involved in cellulose biosynthesis